MNAASIRVWCTSIRSNGNIYRSSISPFPDCHFWCCNNSNGTHYSSFGHTFMFTLNFTHPPFLINIVLKNVLICKFFHIQITTARKAVTLLLSYLIFTKPLTEQHGTGLLLISMGIVLKLLPADNSKTNKRVSSNVINKNVNRSEIRSHADEDEPREEERRPLV